MPAIGETVVCVETGKSFVVAQEGHTFNYATTSGGAILSDEGVDIREKRELLDRSKPFTAYLSSDGKYLTGWKGNKLGIVVRSTPVALSGWSYTHGTHVDAVRVKDIHGGLWHGRGSAGMCITIRPLKSGGKLP